MGAKAVYVNALNMADGGQGHGPDGQTQHEKAGSEAPPSLAMSGKNRSYASLSISTQKRPMRDLTDSELMAIIEESSEALAQLETMQESTD